MFSALCKVIFIIETTNRRRHRQMKQPWARSIHVSLKLGHNHTTIHQHHHTLCISAVAITSAALLYGRFLFCFVSFLFSFDNCEWQIGLIQEIVQKTIAKIQKNITTETGKKKLKERMKERKIHKVVKN